MTGPLQDFGKSMPLKKQLAIAFSAVSLLTVICALAAVYIGYDTRRTVRQATERDLPILDAALDLTQNVERAIAQVLITFAISNRNDAEMLVAEWDETDARIASAVESLPRAAQGPSMDQLLSQLARLSDIRTEITDVTAERRRLRLDQHKAVEDLQAAQKNTLGVIDAMLATTTADPLSQRSNAVLNEMRGATIQITTSLLTTTTETSLSQLSVIDMRSRSYLDQMAKLAATLPAEQGAVLRARAEALVQRGVRDGSLSALRNRELQIIDTAAMLKDETLQLSQRIDATLTELAATSRQAFLGRTRANAGLQLRLTVLVEVLAIASIAAAIFVWVYIINNRFVTPLDQVISKIKGFEQDNVIPDVSTLPDNEIGRLGQSIRSMAVQRIKADESRQAESHKLGETNAELNRSNKDLEDFAQIASHDLKEPLRAISNHSSFLIEDYEEILDEDGKTRLRRLGALSKRMEHLIADLLHFSRLGHAPGSTGWVKPKQIIQDVIASIEDLRATRNAEVIIETDLPKVHGNAGRISTVFSNLIVNGIKFNETAQPKVRIGFFPEIAINGQSHRDVFYVKDNGIGIQPRFKEDAFRIFKRLHDPKRYGESTGSGLSFVKKIIETDGGTIMLEGLPSGGTVFYFSLPTHGPVPSPKDEEGIAEYV